MWLFGNKIKTVTAFARDLADSLYSSAPPAVVQRYMEGDKKAVRQFTKAVDDTALRLAQFKVSNKMGVFGKAKFHQVFMERLNELGYEKESAQEVNHYIMLKTP